MPALDAALVAIASLVTAAPSGAEVVRPTDAGAIAVHDRPGGAVVTQLRARTPYGSPTRLWVRDRRAGWERVPAADAPGGMGWIEDAETRPARRVVRRIVIDVSDGRLTVRRRQTALEHAGDRRRAPEARPRPAPTRSPTGSTASASTASTARACSRSRPTGARGARSRLAIHGYPPAARSTTESAGCVRVPPGAIERLAREAPPGTPVSIRA